MTSFGSGWDSPRPQTHATGAPPAPDVQAATAAQRKLETLTALAGGLARIEAALSRPPCVMVLGECNSGKSSLVNLLLGGTVLPTSVLANTQTPVLVRHAEQPTIAVQTSEGRQLLRPGESGDLPSGALRSLEVGLPSERLKSFELMDTPGLSGLSMFNEPPLYSATQVPVWCTVATQAWKESERQLWLSLPRSARSHGLLVATHKDALRSDDEIARVQDRLVSVTKGLFRHVLLVSCAPTRSRADGGADAGPDLRPDTGIKELVTRIIEGVTEIRLKRLRAADKIVRRMTRLMDDHADVGGTPMLSSQGL